MLLNYKLILQALLEGSRRKGRRSLLFLGLRLALRRGLGVVDKQRLLGILSIEGSGNGQTLGQGRSNQRSHPGIKLGWCLQELQERQQQGFCTSVKSERKHIEERQAHNLSLVAKELTSLIRNMGLIEEGSSLAYQSKERTNAFCPRGRVGEEVYHTLSFFEHSFLRSVG